MSLKHGLLGLLDYSNMTGYELGKSFDDSLAFFWQAQSSQIYRELNKMEEDGWLTSRIEIQTDKPNKRIYSITDTGRDELKSWLDSEIPGEMMPTRSEILMRVFFSAGKSTDENLKMLQKIAAVYREQTAQMAAADGIIGEYRSFAHSEKDILYWQMTADFGRAYSSMCLEWAENCIAALEGMQK